MPNIGLLAGRWHVALTNLVVRGVVQQTTTARRYEDPHG